MDNRSHEDVLDYCRAGGIAFIPWFPIGGGELQGEDLLSGIASAHGVGVRQVALAWLLHHAENILLIPGTSSVAHLEENMKVAEVSLSESDLSDSGAR